MPHPQRERAHARPAILNAARQLFRTESYGGISVERIAATAQVTRHTLNNHFASKDEIFRLSREALVAEVSELMIDVIPIWMKTEDGILHFLKNCFSVFSSAANLELMISITRDGRYHAWLEDLHQRQIRGRLIQICETFLLYHIDRSDEIFADTRVVAEQLTMLAESLAYGPYGNNWGKGVWSRTAPEKNFALAARAIGTLLETANPASEQLAAMPAERVRQKSNS